jgi:hypothetical protein
MSKRYKAKRRARFYLRGPLAVERYTVWSCTFEFCDAAGRGWPPGGFCPQCDSPVHGNDVVYKHRGFAFKVEDIEF